MDHRRASAPLIKCAIRGRKNGLRNASDRRPRATEMAVGRRPDAGRPMATRGSDDGDPPRPTNAALVERLDDEWLLLLDERQRAVLVDGEGVEVTVTVDLVKVLPVLANGQVKQTELRAVVLLVSPVS